jgi:hypothetical protein
MNHRNEDQNQSRMQNIAFTAVQTIYMIGRRTINILMILLFVVLGALWFMLWFGLIGTIINFRSLSNRLLYQLKSITGAEAFSLMTTVVIILTVFLKSSLLIRIVWIIYVILCGGIILSSIGHNIILLFLQIFLPKPIAENFTSRWSKWTFLDTIHLLLHYGQRFFNCRK